MLSEFNRYQWFDTQSVAPQRHMPHKVASSFFRIVGKVLKELFA